MGPCALIRFFAPLLLIGRFGIFYWLLALLFGGGGIIKDLWQGCGWIGGIQTFFRSLYFSIVTMTKLGFGDMHAAESGFLESVLGNIFLSIQVLLGYILLGALITRLGILFTGEAPAAAPTPASCSRSRRHRQLQDPGRTVRDEQNQQVTNAV